MEIRGIWLRNLALVTSKRVNVTMCNNSKCSKRAAFWRMAAVCASSVFLTLPAIADTEATGAVSSNFIESGTNELAELAEFNKKKKQTGVSQYYYYAAAKPQYFSLSRLSKLSAAPLVAINLQNSRTWQGSAVRSRIMLTAVKLDSDCKSFMSSTWIIAQSDAPILNRGAI